MGSITSNFDFKPRRDRVFRQDSRMSHKYWGLLGASLVVASVMMTILSSEAEAIRGPLLGQASHWYLDQVSTEAESTKSSNLPTAKPAFTPKREVVVSSGDTISGLLIQFGIGSSALASILNSDAGKALNQIKPGQVVSAHYTSADTLEYIEFKLSLLERVHIVAGDEGYTVTLHTAEPEVKVVTTRGTITDSLYATALRSGLSDQQIMSMAKAFQWDIDFAQDIQPDDSFAVVYEQRYVDGERLGDGAILAAEFVNQGKKYQLVRYTDALGNSDYYRPDGSGLRKAFIRSPVDFAHVSSGFGHRYHPVLNRMRAHKGVDYAAATGTPIKATGNGTVAFLGNKSGYGKTIILKHQSGYQTLYAHLSRFNSNVRIGSSVKLGQVIGYVGSSGLATGPHLHYEFQVNGVHRNPLTVALPNSEPLPQKYRKDFKVKSSHLIAQLDNANVTPGVAFNAESSTDGLKN